MVRGLLDAKQVGQLLGVNPRTIYKWHREGRILGVPFSRLIRFRPSAIDIFLKREGILRENGTVGIGTAEGNAAVAVTAKDGLDRFLDSPQHVKQIGKVKHPNSPPRSVREPIPSKYRNMNVDDVVSDVLGVRLGARK